MPNQFTKPGAGYGSKSGCWKQLPIGARVRFVGKYKRGEQGMVAERLDPVDSITGYARYAVVLDIRMYSPDRVTVDCCRWELQRVKEAAHA